ANGGAGPGRAVAGRVRKVADGRPRRKTFSQDGRGDSRVAGTAERRRSSSGGRYRTANAEPVDEGPGVRCCLRGGTTRCPRASHRAPAAGIGGSGNGTA